MVRLAWPHPARRALRLCLQSDARSWRSRVTMPRMTAELVLSALYESDDTGGDVTAIAVTDQRIIAVGRAADRAPLVLASSDARHFEPCATPREALCDALAVGDSLWAGD